MFILARRVTGQLIRFYPTLNPQRNGTAWAFAPNPLCALVRQELSGPGMCAIGRTIAEARQILIDAEMYDNG